MYRGGNWNNGSNAGVFYLNGNNSRSNANTNIGFRAALALFVYFLRPRPSRNTKAKGMHFPADKAKDTRSCCSAGGGTGDTEQTAQAGRCLLCGQKADPDPMAWLP